MTSFDPNYRASLWKSANDAKHAMRSLIPCSDIVKASEDELELLTGESNIERAAKKLLATGVSVVFITCGSGGAYFHTASASGFTVTHSMRLKRCHLLPCMIW